MGQTQRARWSIWSFGFDELSSVYLVYSVVLSTNEMIVSVRHREKLIEYRPHVQHRLKLRDDSFDLRYCAFLRIQYLVEHIYNREFQQSAARFAEKVQQRVREFVASSNEHNKLSFIECKSSRFPFPCSQHPTCF